MHECNLFFSFADLDRHLDNLGLFRMTPGLERMQAMLARLGLVRPPYAVVQVVGTNGKGSTSTMLERLAREHGLTTGLHTSPHFLSVRERVRVNGAMLPEADWTALGNTLLRRKGGELSYFEFVTALAVLAFAEAGVDIAVMETGLGGTFDATSALEADLLVFTPFSLDHRSVLGASLREIARDKAGAIRPGKPAVSAPQEAAARAELLGTARERRACLREISPCFPLPPGLGKNGAELRLRGTHQAGNARLALAAWRMLSRAGQGGGLSATALAKLANVPGKEGGGARESRSAAQRRDVPGREGRGPETRTAESGKFAEDGEFAGPPSGNLLVEAKALASAWLPGRMQRLPALGPAPGIYSPCASGWPPLLLDGAHNAHGLAALGLSLAREGVAPLAVVFSCMKDKDLDAMLPHLRALATGLIVVPPVANNPRTMAPADLAALIGLNALPAASLREALETAATHMAERMPELFDPAFPHAERHPLLVCGSLYLLGDFYALRPEALSEQG